MPLPIAPAGIGSSADRPDYDEVRSLVHDRDTWHTVSEIGAANPTVVDNPVVMGHFDTLTSGVPSSRSAPWSTPAPTPWTPAEYEPTSSA